MSITGEPLQPRRSHLAGIALAGLVVLGVVVLLVARMSAAQAVSSVGLGTADSFVVLAGAGVSNTGPTTLNGDLGSFPTTTITGLGTVTLNGTNHAGDALTQSAKVTL